jgi:hypothetical protein
MAALWEPEPEMPDIKALPIPKFAIGQKVRSFCEGYDGGYWWNEFIGIITGLTYRPHKGDYRYVLSAYRYRDDLNLKVDYPYEIELSADEGEPLE